MESTAEGGAAVTEEEVRQFETKGFIVRDRLLTPAQVASVKREIVAICRGDRGPIAGLQPIPKEVIERERDETGSDDDEAEEAELLRRYLAFHFPHKMSEEIRKVMFHQGITSVLERVVSPNVKSMQTMIFIKGPGKPGQAWHQDEFYIPTRDRSLCGVWIALDDATIENGCLWVIPGSHRPSVLWPQRQHSDKRFDAAGEAHSFPWNGEGESSDAVPVELKSGGAVFFNGYLLHRSLPNVTASNYRRALAIHYMSAESILPWDWDGRLKLDEIGGDMRDVEIVCGKDPYAWKPIQKNLTYPYIRAEKAGEGVKFNEVVSSTSTTPIPAKEQPAAATTCCVVLKDMFDPAAELEPGWLDDIKEDVQEECRKHGQVIQVAMLKESQGLIYVKMDTPESAQKLQAALDGRWFAAKIIIAEFVSEATFNNAARLAG